ncbi:helix-turn-helix domain-containing protein [Leifsonia aquatica]|uniref:helix-turn-helix domain-containing protein n=1 Tax=Leifsonia aquatica TaxID=144185 RepID=UPI000468DB07|nr:helix-turn-helix transcriptional regulator [Leifsonia aquatica]
MVIAWNELRDARERLHLTQEELASQLGVSTRTVTNWEANGVARKAEYKVERFFGDALVRDTAGPSSETVGTADEDPAPRATDLSGVSDLALLEELTRRAVERARIGVSVGDGVGAGLGAGLGGVVGASRNTDDHIYEEFEVSYELPTKKGVALAAKRGTRKADQPHAE